jgi:hypothetical protein
MTTRLTTRASRLLFWGPLTAATFVTFVSPGTVRACTPWAEAMLVWDGASDLAVVASWKGIERPPESLKAVPHAYELRRISTGEQVARERCSELEDGASQPESSPASCDWKLAFARLVPPTARWSRPGKGVAAGNRLRVRRHLTATAQEFALEARSKTAWRRVLWLDFISRGYREHRRYWVGPSMRLAEDVVLAVQFHSTGGNCNQTVVQILRLRQADIDDPKNRGRQAHMLTTIRQDAALEHWRTVAELGPLPPGRLLEALSLAENEGYWEWGAQWWRAAIARLPANQVASLTDAILRDPTLASTREILGLGSRPQQTGNGR